MVLIYFVESVMDINDGFFKILDRKAGNWLVEEICELIVLVLCCIEL